MEFPNPKRYKYDCKNQYQKKISSLTEPQKQNNHSEKPIGTITCMSHKIRQGTAPAVHFSLILWYVAKIIPTL